jgi:AcrR family transcriptional regulator
MDEHQHGTFTLRELGQVLGVHNTAFYRHFRDKHELLRAVADRVLDDVASSAEGLSDPFDGVLVMCTTLRRALLSRPAAARVLAEGPARQRNELRLTENLLTLLRQTGLRDEDCVGAYHALIEYAVGSAVVDHPIASMPDGEREAVYRQWRASYLGLDAREYPQAVALSPAMYRGAGPQFEFGLRLMVDALRRRATPGAHPADTPERPGQGGRAAKGGRAGRGHAVDAPDRADPVRP